MKRKRTFICHCCQKQATFCWVCRGCDFEICQECMNKELWGMTCNNIDWVCPNCGTRNGFGNQ